MTKSIDFPLVFLGNWHRAFRETYGWSRNRSYRLLDYYSNYLSKFNLKSTKVLDIGGGSGLLSFVSTEMGAVATCIDPLGVGSNLNMTKVREVILSGCTNPQIEFWLSTFQDAPESESFDFIFLHNSVNHLNEKACIELKESDLAKNAYAEIFRKITRISNKGAYLVLSDCSTRNLFGDLGLVNPVAPTINWNLHQDPSTWINLIENCDFELIEVTWSSLSIFGKFGRRYLRNKLFAYLTSSHFTIIFRKK